MATKSTSFLLASIAILGGGVRPCHPSRVRRRGRRGRGAGASIVAAGVRRLPGATLAPRRDCGLAIDGVWLRVADVRGGGAGGCRVLAAGDHRGGREGIHVLKYGEHRLATRDGHAPRWAERVVQRLPALSGPQCRTGARRRPGARYRRPPPPFPACSRLDGNPTSSTAQVAIELLDSVRGEAREEAVILSCLLRPVLGGFGRRDRRRRRRGVLRLGQDVHP